MTDTLAGCGALGFGSGPLRIEDNMLRDLDGATGAPAPWLLARPSCCL